MNIPKRLLTHDALQVAACYGTPSYIFYEKVLKRNYNDFSAAFRTKHPQTSIMYSVKTNYHPAVLAVLKTLGAGAEVVSGFELYLALKMGFSPSSIVFNGPCKSADELDLAIRNDVFLINADSTSELSRIEKVAARRGKIINVGLRVNTQYGWKKFGIPIEHAENAFKLGTKLKNINLSALHIHLGTSIRSIKPYIHAVGALAELMSSLERMGVRIDLLDLGGGFTTSSAGRWIGAALFQAISKELSRFGLGSGRLEKKLDLSRAVYPRAPTLLDYSSSICNRLKLEIEERKLPLPTLILEPGRYLVNDAFALLLSVADVKETGGRKWAMVDGGINLAPFLETEAHRLFNVSRENAPEEEVMIGGPLCTEKDILCRKATIASPKQGDLIEILDVGAYSLSMSWQFIRPRAPVIMITENGEIKETRRRETPEDMLKLDFFA